MIMVSAVDGDPVSSRPRFAHAELDTLISIPQTYRLSAYVFSFVVLFPKLLLLVSSMQL